MSSPMAVGLSQQAFAIFPKLIEADNALAGSAWLRERVIEVHPEVCFRAMAGAAVAHAKKGAAGKTERRALLTVHGFLNLAEFEVAARRLGAAADDALDACAAAWSAWRKATGAAQCFPDESEAADHHMRIWF